MRVGRVIGKLTLNCVVPLAKSGRWLVVSPFDKEQFKAPEKVTLSKQPSLVVFDELGASDGDIIGFTEGGEAMLPFEDPMPIDAYTACIFEKINFSL